MSSTTLGGDTFVQDCLNAGCALAGVTSADPPERGGILSNWFDDGCHGSMQWLGRHRDIRMDPRLLLSGARSIICVADRYPLVDSDEGPRIASYARGRDYHKVIKKRLHALCDRWSQQYPAADFRTCIDTAPLLEREVAERAGLGRVGKNTLLIEPSGGSQLLLGEVLTTLHIRPTPGQQDDPCGTCTRCIDACPTDALTPWRLDARRCISAMTIEHREVIDSKWHQGIGRWLFGCDACQTACPHNHPTVHTQLLPVGDTTGDRVGELNVLEVMRWTADDRVERLGGTSMTRATLEMLRRNACIVAGTMGDSPDRTEICGALQAIVASDDQPDMVRAAAIASLERLNAP